MKFLKTLLIVVLVVVIGALIYIAMIPKEYNISRSRIIDVPVENSFAALNDLKIYEDWGPWHEEDPTIKVTYGEQTVGVGASDSWTSKEGPGKMWITEVTPNKEIKQKIQFGEFEPGEMIFKLKEMDDSTEVTWVMASNDAPFVFKAAAAFSGGWDNMFSPMQERGLERLDSLLTTQYKEQNSFSFTDPKVVPHSQSNFVGYRLKLQIDQQAMSAAFAENMPKVAQMVMKQGYKYGEFTPAAVYYNWDEEKNETDFLIGVKIDDISKFDITITDLEIYTTNAENAVMVSKFGNYGNGDYEAHTAIGKYMKENSLIQEGSIYELYVNDPMENKPQDIQTDIYYPLAN